MKNKRLLGNILLIVTAIIWGCAFAAQRAGMESIEPISFTAARMALAAVAVGPVALLSGRRKKDEAALRTDTDRASLRRNAAGGICCGSFLAAASLFQQVGVVYTTAGKAGFITAMYMLLVPILHFLLYKKKNRWHVWLAVLIGVVGMYLLCVTESFRLTRGDTLVFVCALLFSGHILCCDHFARTCDPIRVSAIQFLTAAVISAVLAFLFEEPRMDKFAAAAVPILYCGLLSGGLGYTLQIVAQRFTDPTVASLLMSLESVFAVLAGALLLHERMSGRELAGCLVMFAAIVLVQIPLPEKNRQAGC